MVSLHGAVCYLNIVVPPYIRVFFNISENKYDANDIVTIETHLHDILLRIIFKIVGYEGTYQPPVTKEPWDARTDWVVPSLPASELGYE